MQLIAQKFNATLCRVIAALLLIGTSAATCAADGSVANLPQISRQLQKLKADEAAEKRRIDSDEQLIQELERRLEQVDARDRSLAGATEKLTTTNNQIKEQTEEKLQTLQSRLDSGSPTSVFDSAMGRYFGQHQFTFAGAAAGAFTYDRQSAQNSFALVFEPLVLYKLNDWILFEAEIEAGLPRGSGADFGLPVATAQIFLNDYLEINAGKFDQPFGDWYEAHSALWVNRFVTAPLPYGQEALVPPSDLGIQLRGSAQWGDSGQDVDTRYGSLTARRMTPHCRNRSSVKPSNRPPISACSRMAVPMAGASASIPYRSTRTSAGWNLAHRPTTASGRTRTG